MLSRLKKYEISQTDSTLPRSPSYEMKSQSIIYHLSFTMFSLQALKPSDQNGPPT